MIEYNPMRELPSAMGFKQGDEMVLCGELFNRGYANGLLEEARRHGLTIIGTTVGRRNGEGLLRSLTDAELKEAEQNLGGRIINIPLEAGFDMEAAADGRTPLDQLKGIKPDEWERVRLDWNAIEESRNRGAKRFTGNLALVADELEQLVPPGANVLFAHTMAGGIPRARLFMPLFNRIFKGKGDRYLASESFWNSDLGRLCQICFDEVTADTFRYLLDVTAPLRERIAAGNGRVAYVAYGYHGCEVLIDGAYAWQSYVPYLQGWAKMRLEKIASDAWQEGVKATVYNCPEIQTNSSALFLGVEISLYPLLTALEREGGGPAARDIRAQCQALLKEEETVEGLLKLANDYLADPLMSRFADLSQWPLHNTPEQAELMLTCSSRLSEINSDPKEAVCALLSTAVITAVGQLMFAASWNATGPVCWLNHDIVARRLLTTG
jgi:hypothetical protein